MTQKIGYVAVVVRDYDEALTYFIKVLGFELIEDTSLGREKRWVLIAPPGSQGSCLLLTRAATPEQAIRVGNQTGGRVFLFLHTDNFWRDYHAMNERGVNFQEVPREESYGTVAVFEDIDGNRWDLLQLKITGRKSQVENGAAI
jgi:catechol 2,3-dioxygenase-like lactoylglutathione lyase family enzyme